jgi:hypothetical protein
VKVAIVGNPLLVPYLLEEFMKLVKIGEQRRGYGYMFLYHLYSIDLTL